MITTRRSIIITATFVTAGPVFAQFDPPTALMMPIDVKMAPQFFSAVLPRAEMSLTTALPPQCAIPLA